MLEMTVGNVLRTAFQNSDGVGKGIVVILVVASIISVSILWNKVLTILQMQKACNAFLKRYDSVHSPLATGMYLDELSGPLKSACQIGLREVQEICELNDKRMEQCMRSAQLPRKLTQAELDKIRSSMNREVNQQALQMDEGLGCLSVAVTVSPFLGLFGTVWGVMSTFCSIASSGRIEINLIAPGISGALLTTVMGLFVAIPAVTVNTVINAYINAINMKMDIFVDDFVTGLTLEETTSQPEQEASNPPAEA